jgi:hypothetical protein
MDWLTTMATALGSAWLSGINLYATVLTLGLLQRFGLAHLPGELGALSDWRVIAVAAGLYAVEFVADKVPAVDTAWDAVHTFIRVPAGAVLAASAFADFDPIVRMVALLVGGGLAVSSHGSQAATRVATHAMSPPGTGLLVSVGEDLLAFASTILLVFHPLIVLGLVVLALAVTAWFLPKVIRALLRLLRWIRRGVSGGSARLGGAR